MMTQQKEELMPIQKTAYRKYQLYWIADHGFSMDDLFKKMASCSGEIVSDDEPITAEVLKDLFEETGLGSGSLYPCFDEFLDYEYRDSDLMEHILTAEEFVDYCTDRGLIAPEKTSNEFIQVETPHGTIMAKDKNDPEYPGIELFFMPTGEIPHTYAEGPGVMMEFNPTYRGGWGKPELKECIPKVVLWVYKEENPNDDPSACFEME